MKHIGLLILLILSTAFAVTAQIPIADICPTITVTAPEGITKPGDRVTFTAMVTGIDNPRSLTYNWTVTSGTIAGGQGTPIISVATTKDMEGSNITATVDIGWPLPACEKTASETAILASLPRKTKFDEFSKLNEEDLLARIDVFYIELQENPTASGIIQVVMPRKNLAARRYIESMHNPMTFLKKDVSRITYVVSVDPDIAENTATFWLVPAGADAKDLMKGAETIKGLEFKTRIAQVFRTRRK